MKLITMGNVEKFHDIKLDMARAMRRYNKGTKMAAEGACLVVGIMQEEEGNWARGKDESEEGLFSDARDMILREGQSLIREGQSLESESGKSMQKLHRKANKLGMTGKEWNRIMDSALVVVKEIKRRYKITDGFRQA